MPAALVASALVGLAIVYVELVLGELVPKALALRYTEQIALLVSAPVPAHGAARRAGSVDFLTASTRLVLRVFGIRDAGPRTFVSEEEIKHLVKEGRQQGVLDQTEMEIIHSVFEFTDTPVRKVMVPRPKIFALDADTPPTEVGSLIVESGFSRIPAYEGSLDNVVGVVYVKDALRLLEKRQPVVIRKILHPVHLVPETKKVGELLKELQKRRSHMALVIDEHGSVSGLVTLEDLIEQIVGEIQDEYDWEERPVEKLRDGSMVVEGTVSAAELRETPRDPAPRVRRVRDGGRLHAGAARVGAQGRRGRGGRRLALHRRGRRAQPHQQGQDREAPRLRPRQGLTLRGGLSWPRAANSAAVRDPTRLLRMAPAIAGVPGRLLRGSLIETRPATEPRGGGGPDPAAMSEHSDAVRGRRGASGETSGGASRAPCAAAYGLWGSGRGRRGRADRLDARRLGRAGARGATGVAGGTSKTNGEVSPPTRKERRSASSISVRRMTCGVRVITMSVCETSSLLRAKSFPMKGMLATPGRPVRPRALVVEDEPGQHVGLAVAQADGASSPSGC